MSNNEHAVAKTNELQDGEMKLVEVGETKVLLCRVDGTYYAVGGTCTHYGAPLGDGVLSDDRVVCPWHHAAFSVKTGDMLEPPALDSLPKFDVRVSGDDVLVLVPDDVEAHRIPELSTVSPASSPRPTWRRASVLTMTSPASARQWRHYGPSLRAGKCRLTYTLAASTTWTGPCPS